ncbi:MAG: amidohydrolase [Anaerolineae bacterium]|nr:amidohydrolase [Anaerolineae bacterium]
MAEVSELVLYHGAIRTMDPSLPLAEAVWLKEGKIALVGSSAKVLAAASPEAERIDLQGRTVLPGFEDAHLHFGEYGLLLQRVDLRGASSLSAALERVRLALREHPKGEWLQGSGWDHNLWPGAKRPSRYDLDQVAPDVPIALRSKDGHSLWVNSLALQLAQISASTPDPPGGQILRDEAGEPTGILVERALGLIVRHIPKPSKALMERALRLALREAARLGVTSIHNCEGPESFAAFQELAANGELTLRVWHMIPLEHLSSALALGLRTGFGNSLLRVGHVKIFADGALGSRTAEMLAPYEGSDSDRGVATLTTEEIYAAVRDAAQGGLACAIHAIGDAANRRVLDVYERVKKEGWTGALRQRIEHVQLLAPEDLPRLAELGVIASMQPVHATQDMEMADRHWGRRARWSYAWRSLLDQGTTLAFGTDCPVESLDPLAGLYAAVTRQRRDGSPPGGWYPEERLSLDEAIYAYTMGSAIASGEEREKGSISPGKWADLVVLSQDIYRGPPEVLLETRVEMTIFAGRVIYRAE